MAGPNENDELARWAAIMNRTNGYGGVFDYQTSDDKRVVELSTAREWCKSVAAEFGWTVGEPIHNRHDPPDCHISVEGQNLGVELRQLLDSEHKRRAANGETPYAGQLFADSQWSKDRLVAKLVGAIQAKGRKYELRGKMVDVLLIHTAEPWLSSGQAREWLTDVQFEPHPSVASAFLLLNYEPRGVEHWPVFRLYGDLSRARSG